MDSEGYTSSPEEVGVKLEPKAGLENSGVDQEVEAEIHNSAWAFPEISDWNPPRTEAFDDIRLFGQVKSLEYVRNKDITNCATAIREVIDQIRDIDYFLVTGKSREFVRRILLAGGIPDAQIIEFDHSRNASIYKILGGASADVEERTQTAKEGLLECGVPLKEGNPSVTVVEDQIATGTKASEYIRVFSRIPEVGEFRYSSFTTPGIMEVGSRKEQLDKFGEDGLSKLVFPKAGSTTEGASTILHTLSRLYSTLQEENESNHIYSEEARRMSREKVEYATNRLLREVQRNS